VAALPSAPIPPRRAALFLPGPHGPLLLSTRTGFGRRSGQWREGGRKRKHGKMK